MLSSLGKFRRIQRPFGVVAAILAVTCLSAAAARCSPVQGQSSSAGPNTPAAIAGSATVSEPVRIMDFTHVAGTTTIAFRYTSLVPGAAGQAEVEPFKSTFKINATFSNLPAASKLGSQYLAYTLWQVTSDGRTTNLGEIELTGSSGEIHTKSRALRFGLIVTAEPYFAVSRPSSALAFEADTAPGSTAKLPLTQADCELLRTPIGVQSFSGDPPEASSPAEPVLFEEARRALLAARTAGAPQYAPQTLDTAEQMLRIARNLMAQGAKKNDVHDAAEEAVLVAEDARVLAEARKKRAQTAAPQDPAP